MQTPVSVEPPCALSCFNFNNCAHIKIIPNAGSHTIVWTPKNNAHSDVIEMGSAAFAAAVITWVR